MPDALSATAAIALVFILAGFVKGVIGMGLPTVAMGFLTLLMPPAEAAAVLILPSFVTNVWQLAAGKGLMALLRRLWLMQVAGALATVAAAHWLGPVNSAAAVTGLGAALVLYALVSLAPLDLGLPAAAETWLGPIVGAATGIVTALTGVFVLPAVPYLQALRLDPEDLVQALGLSFTVSTLALGVALAADGQFHAPHLGASLLRFAGRDRRNVARADITHPHAAGEFSPLVSARPHGARRSPDAARDPVNAGVGADAHVTSRPASIPLALRSSPVRGPARNLTRALAPSPSFADALTPAE